MNIDLDTIFMIVLVVAFFAFGLGKSRPGQGDTRSKALQAWAEENGWTFVGDSSELSYHWRIRPFGIGTNRSATDTMTGSWLNGNTVTFTYSWRMDHSPRDDRMCHVVAWDVPQAIAQNLPLALEDGSSPTMLDNFVESATSFMRRPRYPVDNSDQWSCAVEDQTAIAWRGGRLETDQIKDGLQAIREYLGITDHLAQ